MNDFKAEITAIPFFCTRPVLHIDILTEGKNNRNYKVTTPGESFFVKIFHQVSAQGVNRQAEYEMLQKLYHAGYGVKPLAFDLTTHSLITEFLEVPIWHPHELRRPTVLKVFGETLHLLHDLSPVKYHYTIEDLLDRYWISLKDTDEGKAIQTLFESTRANIETFAAPEDLRFCHNDLYHANLLQHDGIKFIDLEMAGMNDLYFDLAAFIHFQQLDQQQINLFLQAYTTSALNQLKLSCYRDAILIRELLWARIQLQEGYTGSYYLEYHQECWEATQQRLHRKEPV